MMGPSAHSPLLQLSSSQPMSIVTRTLSVLSTCTLCALFLATGRGDSAPPLHSQRDGAVTTIPEGALTGVRAVGGKVFRESFRRIQLSERTNRIMAMF